MMTSWNTPLCGCETTTNAGELRTLPEAQLGRQSFTVNVPLPDPWLGPQMDHVTVEIDVPPPVQPMTMVVGRTLDFDPGRQDTTRRPEGPAVEAADVTTCGAGAGASAGGGGGLAANPIAKPMPRAATTATVAPTRATVLRRNVMTSVTPSA